MSPLLRIPSSSYQRTRWKNDGGWTTEIARSGGDDFRWRIRIAEIESDGPFLLNVMVPHQEHVLPMIPAGMTVKDMIKA